MVFVFCFWFFRIGLTGTPLQNRLLEFWCVLDWANPGSLGNSKRFDAEFGKAIRRGQRFDSTKRELAQGRKSKRTRNAFVFVRHETIGFMVRLLCWQLSIAHYQKTGSQSRTQRHLGSFGGTRQVQMQSKNAATLQLWLFVQPATQQLYCRGIFACPHSKSAPPNDPKCHCGIDSDPAPRSFW